MESQVMEFQENSHRGRVSEKNDENSDVKFSKRVILTLIGKSWKTHPEIFPKFQFSGA